MDTAIAALVAFLGLAEPEPVRVCTEPPPAGERCEGELVERDE